MFNKKFNSNNRGQIFIVSVVMAVTIALGTSFILLSYLYDSASENQAIGKYQSAIVNSLSTSDQLSVYLSSAYKLSVNQAIYEYLHENPKPVVVKLEEDGAVDSTDINYCGNYVYRIWNSNTRNCYPDISSTNFELNDLISSNMAKLTYAKTSSNNDPELKTFNNILSQEVYYDYSYKIIDGKTTITASPNTNYNIYMFNGKEVEQNLEVQTYIENKKYSPNVFSTSGGDIPGIPFIAAGPGHFKNLETKNVKYIVIHATAGGNIAGAQATFQTSGGIASAHYIIGSTKDDYRIIQMVLDKDRANHAGCYPEGTKGVTENICRSEYASGMNTYSIGIEVVNEAFDSRCAPNSEGKMQCVVLNTNKNACENGRQKIFYEKYFSKGIDNLANNLCWTKYPPEQYNKVVALTALLVKKYGVQVDREHIIGHVEVIKPGTGHVDPGPLFDLDKFVEDVRKKVSETNTDEKLISELTDGKTIECIKGEDKYKWDIEPGGLLSSNSLTSDQEIIMTMNIKNEAGGCILLKPRAKISYKIGGKDYVDEYSTEINSYSSTDKIPFTKVDIKCAFTIDEKEYLANKASRCLILVPNEGSENTYNVELSVLDPENTRKFLTKREEGLLSISLKNSILTFTVKKSSKANTNIILGDLTTAQKSQITKTKENLEKLHLIEYINEQADKENIPREIVFGLITQESGGVHDKPSPAGALGLMQVMPATFEDKSLDFNDCTWEEYKTDVKCQIRAGIAVLKNKQKGVGDKTLYYICNSKNINKKYSGWEAVLRRYNGGGNTEMPAAGKDTSGCTGQPDYEYVEKIMTYTKGWGYSDTTDQMVKDEVNNGILGTYTYKNSIRETVEIPFELFNMLVEFSKKTVAECGVDSVRSDCIKSKTNEFNNKLRVNNIYAGVNLSMNCDDNTETANVNKFVEELNNCANSEDTGCNCKFSNTNVNIDSIVSSEGYTTIKYISENSIGKVYFDQKILDSNNKDIVNNDVTKSYLNFYKQNNNIYQGKSALKECGVVKNIYRLCLKTNYNYEYYDLENNKFLEKKFVIPFAITLRDGVSPKALSGIEYSNMLHDKNSVVLKWTPGTEKDINAYNIYFANDLASIENTQTIDLKNNYNKHINIIDLPYEEYKSIKLDEPICSLQDSSDGKSKYCNFEYETIDKDGKSIKLKLIKEKMYYLSEENKLLFIIDGSKTENTLSSDTDKYLAISAVDSDGSEIDNLNTDQKFVIDANIIKVTPKNNLEPGLVIISSSEITTIEPQNSVELARKTLELKWNPVTVYIDGSVLNEPVQYMINTASNSMCIDNYLTENKLFDKKTGPYNDLEADIDLTNTNTYCVGVGAVSNEDENKKYNSVISKSLNNPNFPYNNLGN